MNYKKQNKIVIYSYAIFLIINYIAAILTGINLLYLFAYILMTFFIIEFLYYVIVNKYIKIEGFNAIKIIRGNKANITLKIKNKSILPLMFINIIVHNKKNNYFIDFIKPKQELFINIGSIFENREYIKNIDIKLTTLFPLSIYFKEKSFKIKSKIWVFPKKKEVKLKTNIENITKKAKHNFSQLTYEKTYNFHSYNVNNYNIKNIDWKKSAKLQKIITKTYQKDNSIYFNFYIDNSNENTLEDQIEIANWLLNNIYKKYENPVIYLFTNNKSFIINSYINALKILTIIKVNKNKKRKIILKNSLLIIPYNSNYSKVEGINKIIVKN